MERKRNTKYYKTFTVINGGQSEGLGRIYYDVVFFTQSHNIIVIKLEVELGRGWRERMQLWRGIQTKMEFELKVKTVCGTGDKWYSR